MSKALFDPGFSKILISGFIYNIEILYYNLNKIKNFGQKKTQFILTFQKGKGLFDVYLGFYLGCMLWGACLKSMENEKIEGNPFLGGTYEKERSLEEINYMKAFVKSFDRDSKYYLGKPFKVDENKLKILDLYEEFVDANEGFSKTDTTDKIKLVGKLNNASKEDIELFNSKINEVINENKIEELLVFCDKI
ncbi:hypothetical protein IKE67_01690 [bacterium]|nr:hypothetical protein [bacterium]